MKRQTLIATLVSVSFVLAACGGDGETAIDPPADQTSTTDAPPSSDLRAPEPISATGGSARQAAGASSAVSANNSEFAASDMMIAPFITEFVLSDDLPALPTEDIGYVFDIAVPFTAEQVARVAAALGVTGDPVSVDQGDTQTWRVGPEDGSAPSVWVYGDAQQTWNYGSAWAKGAVDVACASAADSAGNEIGECPEPEPPVGVPSATEAEQRARETLSALGLDPSTLTFENYVDEWSASVNVDDRTSERGATRYWNFGFGGEGVLQYAGGSLASPERVGPYTLVDLDTAFARLQATAGIGVPMPMTDEPLASAGTVETDSAVATDSSVAPEPVVTDTSTDTSTDSPPPTDIPVVTDTSSEPPSDTPADTVIVADEPIMVDPPMGDREAVTVTLVDVQPDLWWVWDADGSLWLVPAYRFIDTDGGWHVVPAVTDEFLIQTAPTDTALPIEGDGGIGDGAEPVQPPESLPALPDVQPIEPGTDPASAIPVLEQFVGLSIEEFTAQVKALGYSTRVAKQDGESLAVTADYSDTRVNVEVEGPRVTAIQSIG